MTNAAIEISALVTCHYEEATIEEFHSRLSSALSQTGRSYEMIFVNDGSTDNTFEALSRIFARDPKVTAVLDLFKNSGQTAAITAALQEARGSILLSIDSDLQLDPEELPLLLAEYDKGNDIVSGRRKKRRDSWLRIIPSRIANYIMRKASDSRLTDFGCTFKLYNARLVDSFGFGPNNIFNPVAIVSRSNRCREVLVTHHPRAQGKSGWTFSKLWNYQMEHLVRLSARPFQIMGFTAFLFGVLFAIRIAVEYLTPFSILTRISSGLILNAVVLSFMLLFGAICLVGEFSIRSYLASQRLPQYAVREAKRRSHPSPQV